MVKGDPITVKSLTDAIKSKVNNYVEKYKYKSSSSLTSPSWFDGKPTDITSPVNTICDGFNKTGCVIRADETLNLIIDCMYEACRRKSYTYTYYESKAWLNSKSWPSTTSSTVYGFSKTVNTAITKGTVDEQGTVVEQGTVAEHLSSLKTIPKKDNPIKAVDMSSLLDAMLAFAATKIINGGSKGNVDTCYSSCHDSCHGSSRGRR